MSTAASPSESFATFVKTQPCLVLGSASPWRQELFQELAKEHGLDVVVKPAGIDERAIRHSSPVELVLAIGKAKADAVAATLRETEGDDFDGYLITGDQVVVCNGQILEKPDDEAQARAFIKGYADHPSSTVGSIICTHLPSLVAVEWVEKTEIHISPIPEDSIGKLIEEGAVFLSAGGLLIEHPLVSPHITKIVGSEDAVRGMSREGVMHTMVECWKKQTNGQ